MTDKDYLQLAIDQANKSVSEGDINKMFLKPIEIIQIKELADKSMEVVNKWEEQFAIK